MTTIIYTALLTSALASLLNTRLAFTSITPEDRLFSAVFATIHGYAAVAFGMVVA